MKLTAVELIVKEEKTVYQQGDTYTYLVGEDDKYYRLRAGVELEIPEKDLLIPKYSSEETEE